MGSAEKASGGIAIIIPSLRPDKRLLEGISQIWDRVQAAGMEHDILGIVVVNDGSAPEYDSFFERAKTEYNCTILRHAVNLGKGRALKTAFNHCLLAWPGLTGVVTLDADGQHDPDDMLACVQELQSNPEALVLGSRDFNSPDVPFKSRYGNKITRQVFRFLCGVKVGDTQTGLRAIPTSFMKRLMNVPGERFEYEMNMLIECPEAGVPIREVRIRTIYLDDNASSHFNPLVDALRIYAVFFKFLFAGLSSLAIDLILFTLFKGAFKGISPAHYILISTALARVISSLYNFAFNKKVVFKQEQGAWTFVKYYALAVVQMLASAFGVEWLYKLLPISETAIKLVVDSILALISFQIQRAWVFKKEHS